MTMEKKIVIIAGPNGAGKTTFEVALQTNTPLVFMRDGKGYQTRLNLILREAMLKEVTKA